MNKRNKKTHPDMQAWEQKDVQAVDLIPWKYRKIVSIVILICVVAVYIFFSPVGIGVA